MVKETRGKKRKSGIDLVVDATTPDWTLQPLGQGEGVCACYQILFADGHTHPGVPEKDVWRV